MKSSEIPTAIVTGAGHPQGIGHAIALSLAKSGFNVAVCDLAENGPHLLALVRDIEEHGVAAKDLAVDITRQDQVSTCVDQVIAEFGRVDVLVNNAGVAVGSPGFLEMTDADWDLSFAVNVKGMARFAQAVIPAMQAQASGVIVNISSCADYAIFRRHHPVIRLPNSRPSASPRPLPRSSVATIFAVMRFVRAPLIPECAQSPWRTSHRAAVSAWRKQSWKKTRPFHSADRPHRQKWPRSLPFLPARRLPHGAAYLTGAAIPVDGGMNFGL